MAGRTGLVTFSLVLHVAERQRASAVELGYVEVEEGHAATAIEIFEAPKPTPPPIAATPEVPQAPDQPKATAPATRAPAPTPAPAPQPEAASPAAEAPASAPPDFGLSLSGGAGGPSGVAVPTGGGARPAPTGAPPQPKRAIKAPAPAGDGCDEAPIKPRPLSVPQPAYTSAARDAAVEGRVRLSLTVDEQGAVVSVQLLQGLGHGLDEAAIAAARRARFQPGSRCGKPSRATFTISMRFSAT